MFTQTDYDKLQQIMQKALRKRNFSPDFSPITVWRSVPSVMKSATRLRWYTVTCSFWKMNFLELSSLKHWKNMHQNIEYMKQLLEELSDFNNGDRLSLQSLDTNTFLRSVALSFATSILDTDIQMTSKIPPALPVIQLIR